MCHDDTIQENKFLAIQSVSQLTYIQDSVCSHPNQYFKSPTGPSAILMLRMAQAPNHALSTKYRRFYLIYEKHSS